jgi:hypothetical protein
LLNLLSDLRYRQCDRENPLAALARALFKRDFARSVISLAPDCERDPTGAYGALRSVVVRRVYARTATPRLMHAAHPVAESQPSVVP